MNKIDRQICKDLAFITMMTSPNGHLARDHLFSLIREEANKIKHTTKFFTEENFQTVLRSLPLSGLWRNPDELNKFLYHLYKEMEKELNHLHEKDPKRRKLIHDLTFIGKLVSLLQSIINDCSQQNPKLWK